MGALTVLVTSPLLAKEGLALLESAGLDVHFMQAFPKPEDVAAKAKAIGAAGIIARQGAITALVMEASPYLRIIARHGAGTDEIDLDAARARRLLVTRTPGANARAVAEHTIAVILALLKQLPSIQTQLAAGKWRAGDMWVGDAYGARLGLVGMGAIGQHTARLASAFGMKIAATSRQTAPEVYEHARREESLERLLATSDIISLHTALTPETRGMIDAAALARMPKGALIINTARGGLIDETALLAAIESGHIAGAALDVTEPEPPRPDHPFRTHPRVLLTPHIGGVSAGSMTQMAVDAAECIVAALTGGPLPADRIVVPGG
ncbi:hydroxyacid dehydrogenase [Acidisoma cellulosilytica]|uniref:Hydroxyacid dehydrogenase n=1 Tax=Acidisoma cellulosilyticum TaxID=2802395 RepID=A0A963Z1R2_9PROT|nr:NAD(P)-dependent oxidoreductase [Acidisoma cellulosilyticum]MCB8880929.1 hydroxyacid dehydrogenase [Acidisoma cellulosilyticum]